MLMNDRRYLRNLPKKRRSLSLHRSRLLSLCKNGKIMEQYPDIISLTVGGASTQGTDGTWSAPIKTKYTFYCRAEANTSGRKIIGSDGQYYDFQFAVFAPLDGEVTCLTGSTTTYSTVDLVIADIESKRIRLRVTQYLW